MTSSLAAATWHVGDLPTWLLLALGLLVAWRVTKGGGGAAVTELSAANAVLERRVHELESQVTKLELENTALHARTDFAQALRPLLDATEKHETQAAERFEKTAVVLDAIAKSLDPPEKQAA